MHILGIDIGGSGIKGAVVDTDSGKLITERYRLPTPQPSKPTPVGKTVNAVVKHFDWHGPIGCTFPAIVHHGVIFSAANVHQSWINKDCQRLLSERMGCPVTVINDADAAGIAEMTFGAGRGHVGTVVLITLGTGIGSALFSHAQLVPNAEFGHLQLWGKDAETRVSARVRTEKKLSWKKYAQRLDKYLAHVEFLLSPDLIIVGGGISAQHEKFLPRLHRRAPVVPAQLLNEAGIVGVALAAAELAAGKPPAE